MPYKDPQKRKERDAQRYQKNKEEIKRKRMERYYRQKKEKEEMQIQELTAGGV